MYVPGSGGSSKITRSVGVSATDPEISCEYWRVLGDFPRKSRDLGHLGDALAGPLRVWCDGCVTGAGEVFPALLEKGVWVERSFYCWLRWWEH
jgi:hypothetical protein